MQVGYAASERVFTNTTTVKGSNLSIGPEGVHAIQFAQGEGSFSPWLGCPGEGARTNRLVFDSLTAVAAKFDVRSSSSVVLLWRS